jgi:hypothetical protein
MFNVLARVPTSLLAIFATIMSDENTDMKIPSANTRPTLTPPPSVTACMLPPLKELLNPDSPEARGPAHKCCDDAAAAATAAAAAAPAAALTVSSTLAPAKKDADDTPFAAAAAAAVAAESVKAELAASLIVGAADAAAAEAAHVDACDDKKYGCPPKE